MEILLKKLGLSVKRLQCLDEIFRVESPLYGQLENRMTQELGDHLEEISKELYAGGKLRGGLNRQMILGDVIEYIFTGRAYYYAAKSSENFKVFSKLVLYATCVLDGVYDYRGAERNIWGHHRNEFFSQIPQIEGVESL